MKDQDDHSHSRPFLVFKKVRRKAIELGKKKYRDNFYLFFLSLNVLSGKQTMLDISAMSKHIHLQVGINKNRRIGHRESRFF